MEPEFHPARSRLTEREARYIGDCDAMKYLKIALSVIILMSGLFYLGCSGMLDNATYPDAIPQSDRITSVDDHMIWGIYQITFDPATSTASITPGRETEFHANVTDYVKPPNCADCVNIVGSQYKPVLQQWSLDIQLKNPTALTGYDVRGLVFNTGEKYLKNPDGFMNNYLAQNIHFKAFGKIDPQRAFPPGMTYTENYIFHFPTGNNWNTVDYIVDASWPGNAKEPIIEDVTFPESILNGIDIVDLTVAAFDHQDDPITVTADLTPIGGSANEPLYDDGLHNDGGADDGVFGATGITANVSEAVYEIIITAVDSTLKTGWNSFHVTVVEPGNHDPVIDEITMSRTTCLKGSTTEIVSLQCFAHDDDLDDLEYHWSATGGELSDEYGETTEWTPPDEAGKFVVSCEVTDGMGGSTEDDTDWIRVTNYFILPPEPAPGFTCEKLLEYGFFNLSDYTPGGVAVLNFWSA